MPTGPSRRRVRIRPAARTDGGGQTQSAAAAIDPAYFSPDPFEGSIAASNHGQQVIAAGLASGVERYFAPGSAP